MLSTQELGVRIVYGGSKACYLTREDAAHRAVVRRVILNDLKRMELPRPDAVFLEPEAAEMRLLWSWSGGVLDPIPVIYAAEAQSKTIMASRSPGLLKLLQITEIAALDLRVARPEALAVRLELPLESHPHDSSTNWTSCAKSITSTSAPSRDRSTLEDFKENINPASELDLNSGSAKHLGSDLLATSSQQSSASFSAYTQQTSALSNRHSDMVLETPPLGFAEDWAQQTSLRDKLTTCNNTNTSTSTTGSFLNHCSLAPHPSHSSSATSQNLNPSSASLSVSTDAAVVSAAVSVKQEAVSVDGCVAGQHALASTSGLSERTTRNTPVSESSVDLLVEPALLESSARIVPEEPLPTGVSAIPLILDRSAPLRLADATSVPSTTLVPTRRPLKRSASMLSDSVSLGVYCVPGTSLEASTTAHTQDSRTPSSYSATSHASGTTMPKLRRPRSGSPGLGDTGPLLGASGSRSGTSGADDSCTPGATDPQAIGSVKVENDNKSLPESSATEDATTDSDASVGRKRPRHPRARGGKKVQAAKVRKALFVERTVAALAVTEEDAAAMPDSGVDDEWDVEAALRALRADGRARMDGRGVQETGPSGGRRSSARKPTSTRPWFTQVFKTQIFKVLKQDTSSRKRMEPRQRFGRALYLPKQSRHRELEDDCGGECSHDHLQCP
ncbi:hypothetical protein EVJ58_g9212 [Rhodofomes roseus]|uniref:Uncharacterized protein n=1 Tax=Rhodofomes roseus TaxID=34475 RepID=A0A4Y9XUP0_9APHY|nr:hypothetical protein EVJ58_g9212 [Rhodofomes roseus]